MTGVAWILCPFWRPRNPKTLQTWVQNESKIHPKSMLEAMYKRVQLWGALGITKNWFFKDFWPQHGSKRVPKWTPKSMKNRSGSNMASRKGSQTVQGPSQDPPGPHFGAILDPILDRLLTNVQRILASSRALKIACSIQHTAYSTAYSIQQTARSIQHTA